MLADQRVQALIAQLPGRDIAIQRHNDAQHALHKLGMLVDFGLRNGDPGISELLDAILKHQSESGAFQSPVSIPVAFGGSGKEEWTWLACDAPLLLHALLALGYGRDERIENALKHLAGLVEENGWRCAGAPEVGKFRDQGGGATRARSRRCTA